MKKLLLALALLLAPASAFAQCNGVFANNTACGNVSGSSAPPKSIPLSAFPPGAAGTNGQTQYNNSGILGGYTPSGDVTVNPATGVETIQPNAVTTGKILDANVTNAKLAVGAANTIKGSTNGTTTSDLAITSCSAIYQFTQWITGTGWQCGINPVLPSRAIAAGLNLSAFTAVQTQGYLTPADGGQAIFKNVGSAALIEQSVQTCGSIVAGTAYTNGTYRGVPLTGGTGHNAVATVVVAGTVVSSVTITNWGGNAYTASDVLSATNATIGGTGSGFSCVAAVSTALGSFIDTASTHFQIISEAFGGNSTAQFGCKMDYQGVDGSSTDNTACLFNALQYSGNIPTPAITVDAGGSAGNLLVSPTGSGLICPTTKPFQVPSSVRWWGSNIWGTTWKLCSSFANGASEIIDLCDIGSHLACFGTQIANMTFYANNAQASNANTPFIFSNSVQQMNALYRVAIYSGLRSCIQFDTGFGGAAWMGMEGVECTPWPTSTNPGINFTNIGTTILKIKDSHVESGSTGATINGVQITGGYLDIDGFHSEGISTAIFLNNTGSTSTGASRLHNLTGGAHCTNLVLKQGGSVANDVIVGMAVPNGCTNTVNNGGALTTTPVIVDTLY